MSHRLVVRPAALANIEEGAAWHEERQEGLGADFVHAVRRAINCRHLRIYWRRVLLNLR